MEQITEKQLKTWITGAIAQDFYGGVPPTQEEATKIVSLADEIVEFIKKHKIELLNK